VAVSARPISVEGATIHVTLSLGVAVSAGESHTLQKLLQEADEGLYAAKKAGRNPVEAVANEGVTRD
jgi:diguanylate cyclase (GGDEF)-like protein